MHMVIMETMETMGMPITRRHTQRQRWQQQTTVQKRMQMVTQKKKTSSTKCVTKQCPVLLLRRPISLSPSLSLQSHVSNYNVATLSQNSGVACAFCISDDIVHAKVLVWSFNMWNKPLPVYSVYALAAA